MPGSPLSVVRQLPPRRAPVARAPARRAPVADAVVNFGGYGNDIINIGNGAGPSAATSYAVETITPQFTIPADGLVIVDNMTLTPGAGTYRVLFNANFTIDAVPGDITAQAALEVDALYNTLTGLPQTGLHIPTFGLGETLTPGVRDVFPAGPATIDGVLTLDGLGDPNAIFVFRIGGALTSTSGASMVLVNGVVPSNIFWLAEGAIALADNCLLNGTFFAHNAPVCAGNGTGVNGRLISNLGSITTDANFIVVPTNPPPSAVPLGATLDRFILFTSNGNLTNTNEGTYLGNIGTNLGTISGYELPTLVFGGIYPPGSLGPTTTAFSIAAYQNGILIPTSIRDITSPTGIGDRTVTLITTATVAGNEPIDIRSEVYVGSLTMIGRNLTVFLT